MKDLNAAVHVYAAIISQASEKNNILLLKSLLSELKFYQNVITNSVQFFKLLHEFIMHYIKTEKKDILYKFLYNLLLKKFKMLQKYLNNAFIKE